ncbi:hypothetical protein A3L04_08515 [Thermococcus chitonophagus]|uniref:Transcriptional regulator n=1 Tax=Thermococcus chitonophagus TaxID=54262 RepID=A0A2Z2N4P4_9EURY|nr:hypothetical protein [Thermococcus chitonophagus]ASJ17108.1 hypothetical protein A3L04_08515 [Thermococcus chitonophagus]
MKPPVSREKIYSVVFDYTGIRIPEVARLAELNYIYTYQTIRALKREGYLTTASDGRIILLDRKGLIFKWAKDKEVILNSLSPITIKLVPDYDMRNLVLFSGNSALWLLGKIISPASGILYASEKTFKELMKFKDPEGYPFKVYIYDDFYFKIRKELNGYYIPSWGMILADMLVQGTYTRLFDDVFETVISIIEGEKNEEA